MKSLLGIVTAVVCLGCGDDGQLVGGAGQGGAGEGGNSLPGVECEGATCTSTEYCGFAAGTCDGAKSCQPLPGECPASVVCGCDGENHEGPCAALNGVGGVLSDGPCPAPAGKFICNYEYQVPIYCTLGAEYCKVTPSGNVYGLACLAQPAACGAAPADCTCLADDCSENYCAIDDESGAITVLCSSGM